MTRRIRAFATIAILVASLATGAAPGARGARAQARTERPDIIIVLTDQQRADAFGAAGASDLRTPAMDRIAREGVLFTHAFAATPQCSPSRAALIAGRYPHRTGVMGNTGSEAGGDDVADASPPAGMSSAMDKSLPTLGRIFAAAGYETAYFGKWHLGANPGVYGFESHDATIADATLARRVAAYLEKRNANAPRRPLFLIVSWLNPHDIYGALMAAPDPSAIAAAQLPPNLIDDLRQKPFPQQHYLHEDQGKPFVGADRDVWRRYRAFYNGLVETVDREIGTVLEAFGRTSVSPITVFSSDHGDLGGAHGLPFKGPAMYDELVRVPLVIAWPGRIRPARSDALVSLIDVLPTLCDLTGLAIPDGIDGLSLRPLFDAPVRVPAWRDMVFAEYYGKQAWRVPIRMVRTQRWKYVRYLGYGEEFYDLAADPGELRNLAGDPSASSERTRLARELDDWIRRTSDPFTGLTTTNRSGQIVTTDRVK